MGLQTLLDVFAIASFLCSNTAENIHMADVDEREEMTA
jgi:hypothetical protein